jgi:multidrug transporter EmrE-like cation transporter
VLEATLLALAAAVLHAAWNLLLKRSDERIVTAWGFYLAGGLLLVPVLPFVALPGGSALPYLLVSSWVHVAYILALASAYHHGDFSLSYPLARGGGALLAAIGGVAFLGDDLSSWSWLAIAIVVGGLASLVRPSAGRAALLFAGLTAATIGVYTTLDAAGARRSSGFGYAIVLGLAAGAGVSVVGGFMGYGRAFVVGIRRDWRRMVAGGIASTLAYSMVLAAARLAPVGYVAALRESSVVLGAAAGWLVLHERFGRGRLVAAAIVAAGLIFLIATR